ncbi:FAD-dependent oxidoreductase [Sebaldella sp. S0638]|uniref:FAD-dependent oxidoreductase n=1 Tax=Sebaldella sp. S0638 TaxID=2957809 RepID=UPI00209ECEB2|nr:FAD-dependent oxidoreductase [Sebaldella sp. S0638]MCP1225958.1 FAD-dependent oxidoreductase [Sebaldella sp. S0638]
MKMIKELARETEVLAEVDVLVVGSGPSGLAAAIGAAREGADTLILERYGCFGGVITQVGVEGFAWYRHKETIEAGGLVPEFENKFKDIAGANPECQSESQALDAEMFKYVADEMILENNIKPLLHCTAVDVIIEDNIIKGIITESKSGRLVILAKRVIDCTGDADIAALAGAPYLKATKNELMSVTTMFHCKNVDIDRFNDYVKNDLKPTYKDWGGYWSIETTGKEDDLFSPYFEKPFVEGAEEGIVPKEEDVCLGGTWSSVTPEGEVTQLNVVFISNIDCTDVKDLTKAEIAGRRNALYSVEILRNKVPGFENAKLRNFGMTLGTRESRKIEGHYSLTKYDVMNQQKFEDSIAIFPEFIDGVGYLIKPTTGRYYQIPYRCILPQKIDNLLVAGRSISGDKIAHVSFRNMACCVATGQAAGIAAAVSIKEGTTTANTDVKKIQESLINQGIRIF